ncbi:MAG: hypothetical protein KF752_14515 [Pirellulaceae bacterium]|nr:hypothetical protein [Pirellulaceae bacterium]
MMIPKDQLPLLMLIAGMGVMSWLLIRKRARSRRQLDSVEFVKTLNSSLDGSLPPAKFSGAASVGAPKEVLQWQVELHELARQLKAELDTKIVVVRKLTVEYDRAAERLEKLIAQAQRLREPNTGTAKDANESRGS